MIYYLVGIGCCIYTGKETRHIRELYGIDGSYPADIAKGVLCYSCSLMRNELEVRKREEERQLRQNLGLVDDPYSQIQPMVSPSARIKTPRNVPQTSRNSLWIGPSDRNDGDGGGQSEESKSSRAASPPRAGKPPRKGGARGVEHGRPAPVAGQVGKQLVRRAKMLSPIEEGTCEDSTSDGTPRLVENNICRTVQVALQSSPEPLPQRASPRAFSSPELAPWPLNPVVASDALKHPHHDTHPKSPGLLNPKPVSCEWARLHLLLLLLLPPFSLFLLTKMKFVLNPYTSPAAIGSPRRSTSELPIARRDKRHPRRDKKSSGWSV